MIFGEKGEEKNELKPHQAGAGAIFWRQLQNPLLLILLAATMVAYFVGERTDAVVIFLIMTGSVLLGFGNEFRAEKTVDDLLKKVSVMAIVVRNGEKMEIPAGDLRLGDEVLLTTGAVVPADLDLTGVKNLEIDESALTGESEGAEKRVKEEAYMGTVIVGGQGSGVVRAIGKNSRYGKISTELSGVHPETEFQKGLRNFGEMLVKWIVLMAIIILVGNYLLGRPPIEAILFSLAIAIGLTPELLPMIVTVSLAHGARQLAKKEVVVKRLIAIEDLGNMEVLCTDKTGTLTEGKITLEDYFNAKGEKDERVLDLAMWCNTAIVHHRIFGNPIDKAVWEYALKKGLSGGKVEKIAEEEFDFDRRAMWSVVENKEKRAFIYKGSAEAVIEKVKGKREEGRKLMEKYKDLSEQGLRVIAVAEKEIREKEEYSFEDAKDLKFAGFLTFSDWPKKTVPETLARLRGIGVQVKVLTGDNELVTKHVCDEVGIETTKIILGNEVEKLSEEELEKLAYEVNVFARVSPEQKEKIIKALQKGGHEVGYLGDGINDGPALHSADVGISVNTGVDVAKDAASVVLLRKSLGVIAEGIIEGRRIFGNTIKYILMGSSSNFGNMFSAAGASFLLPFLPMTPTQILLTNSLYDVSQLAIPTDNVDVEELRRPKKWDLSVIKKYMLLFGPLSSVYDYLTFGIMWFGFRARGGLFQTGWFVESLITEVLVVFVIRTAKPFYRSRPSRGLVVTALGVVVLGVTLPFLPAGRVVGFQPLPSLVFVIILMMTATYLFIVEKAKQVVFRR